MRLQSFLKTSYVSLLFMTFFTLMTIVNNEISVFYMIYLFWFHEFIRTLISIAFYIFKRDKIADKQTYYATLKSKLFILCIYFIFIFIFFGLMLDWKNNELLFINLQVLMLQHTLFNLTLITFSLRELLLFFNDDLKNLNGNVFLSKGVIILHISIILGILIWGFLPKDWYENTNSNILSGLVIAPFLLLKMFFEIKEAQYKDALEKTV
ncbi:MAG: hypothetical protein NWQ31_05965 [Polaribacter sp.]|nr:hypothetical protein [Polaribacter sp.]